MAAELAVSVLFKGETRNVRARADVLAADVLASLMPPGAEPATARLVHRGRSLRLDQSLYGQGVRAGAKLALFASSAAEVAAVRSARSAPRSAPLEHEEAREARRRAPAAAPPRPPAGPHAVQAFEAWEAPGLAPPPADALALLRAVAADPGVAGLLAGHRWRVGLLSEMPPTGKVGVSPVCVLGVNVNRGSEISLRLRTDDLRGFRRYLSIIETMIHELAHMEISGHGTDFKELNSALRREAAALDWRRAPGAATPGGAAAAAHAPAAAAAAGVAPDGRTLRVAGGWAAPAGGAPAAAAAAAAALRRAGQGGAAPAAPPAPPPPPPPPRAFEPRKGDAVLYRQRDGSYVAAKVASVDLGTVPPSFGVEIDGQYRETELARLAPAPAAEAPAADGADAEADGAPAGVRGLGHYDATTAAKEAAVRALEE
jgi:hypothetical protein